jgi:hypothetical protein
MKVAESKFAVHGYSNFFNPHLFCVKVTKNPEKLISLFV